MSELQGTYVVTAGASGIGRASALAIAAAGGDVAVLDIDGTGGVTVVEEIRAMGGRAIFRRADVRSRAEVAAAVADAETELGLLKGGVAAAGISVPARAEDVTREDWDAVIGVSLTGSFITCHEIGKRLIRNGGGSLVTISSIDAISAHAARAGYCAAKFGVAGMTKSFAIEWGRHGVRVNSVAPGICDTPAVARAIPPEQIDAVLVDRTPAGRMGQPEDMAKATLWLLSDDAAYVTGQILPVDGGLTAGFMTRWQGRDLASNVLLNKGAYAPPG